MTTRHPRLNFSTGILYEEENTPMIPNPLRRNSIIQAERENSSRIQFETEIVKTDMTKFLYRIDRLDGADDYLVDLILCKVKIRVNGKFNAGKAFATFNTIFGILIGILFFIKAAINDGKLSWYGLWLRLGYFILMIVDIHIMNPNPNVDTQTKWAYSVPHISGILLTGFQIVGGWNAYDEQCSDFATCL